MTISFHTLALMVVKFGVPFLRIPKGTPNFTTISARVWNEIVTKIIMDQHVSISKFKTMLKSYLLVSSFTLTYTK